MLDIEAGFTATSYDDDLIYLFFQPFLQGVGLSGYYIFKFLGQSLIEGVKQRRNKLSSVR
jgi:hypothetical protein